ncbi:E motif [Dillenia turbinata]|uniref:E motif n=1 Tax=Dillenia turbinata TaxID=194707 RepID=A0AAN8UX05_9MAGN
MGYKIILKYTNIVVVGGYDVLGPHLNSPYSNYHHLKAQPRVPYCYRSLHLRISFPTRNSVLCCHSHHISDVNNTKNTVFSELEPNPPQNYISSGGFSSKQSSKSVSVEIEETPSQKQVKDSGFSMKMCLINVLEANKMVREFTDNGLFDKAIRNFMELPNNCLLVDLILEFSNFSSLINAVGGNWDLEMERQIHGFLLKLGEYDDIFVTSSLLGMYWKCEAIENASTMFESMCKKDSVSWSTMILGSFKLYPNRVASISALSSCASLESLIHGQEIHAFVSKSGLDVDERLVSCLIDMYTKCGDIRNAKCIFQHVRKNESSKRNLIVWDVMIIGYVYNRCSLQLVEMFIETLVFRIQPDSSTMVALLVQCSQSSNLGLPRQVHGLIYGLGLENDVRVETALQGMEIDGLVVKMGLDSDVYVGGALVDMYTKCKDMESAEKAFARLSAMDLISWNSLICGYAQNGFADIALRAFHTMQPKNIRPTEITLTYSPLVLTYATGLCVRKFMVIRNHGNEKLAESVADYVFKLDPASVGYGVLLSNIYGIFGKWNEVTRIRTKMKDMGLNKIPGCSCTEVDNKVHVFNADRTLWQMGEHEHRWAVGNKKVIAFCSSTFIGNVLRVTIRFSFRSGMREFVQQAVFLKSFVKEEN